MCISEGFWIFLDHSGPLNDNCHKLYEVIKNKAKPDFENQQESKKLFISYVMIWPPQTTAPTRIPSIFYLSRFFADGSLTQAQKIIQTFPP